MKQQRLVDVVELQKKPGFDGIPSETVMGNYKTSGYKDRRCPQRWTDAPALAVSDSHAPRMEPPG